MSATRAGATTTYAYDPSGNLTSVTLPDATAVTYQFDPQGRRIARAVNGVSTGGLIYAEDLAPIAATDATGAITSTFTYGTRGNVPDVMVKDGVTYRIVSDHLGSVRFVVNASTGAIAQRMDYDVFGVVSTDTNPGFTPFGFAGGLYDPATGLTRFGARDYDARSGRWTAKDPIGFAGGDANLYAYVGNDPVNRIDPSGLFCIGNVCSEDVTGFYKEVGGDPYDSWNDGLLCEARQKLREALRFLADFVDIYAEVAWCVGGELVPGGPQGSSSPEAAIVTIGADAIILGIALAPATVGSSLLFVGGILVGAGLTLIAAKCTAAQ